MHEARYAGELKVSHSNYSDGFQCILFTKWFQFCAKIQSCDAHAFLSHMPSGSAESKSPI